MFKRRRASPETRPTTPPPSDIYLGLRQGLLSLDPADAGMPRIRESDVVWGAMMETCYPEGSATLVCLRDGSTSLYTSGGGGIIGGGAHEAVAAANFAFLRTLSGHLDQLSPQRQPSLPDNGYVILRALTYGPQVAASVLEAHLGEGQHPLSPVFYAGHDVITQLRLIDEGHDR